MGFADLKGFLDIASDLTSVGWLVIGLYGGYRGWYVWGRHYEASEARGEQWRVLFMQSQEAAKEALRRAPAHPPRKG